MAKLKVLLVDDNQKILKDISEIIEQLGYSCVVAYNGLEAVQVVKQEDPDIVLTAQNMPVGDGFAVLDATMSREIKIPVIFFTSNGTIEKAVEAMKKGAFNYLESPFSPEKLQEVLKKTLAETRLQRKNDFIKVEMKKNRYSGDLVFRNSLMKQIMNNILKLAQSDANVMVIGESGTGKELVARSVHKFSRRKSQPFIPLDCGALPASLLESELFGFEKGSFTGAGQMKTGIIELASEGTLFLDEITELDIHLQAKLLRVIQEHKFRRIGGKKMIDVNFRVISATNRDPEIAVSSGRLREDLFYRLNVVPIFLPPLRERTEDIPLLVHHFIDKYNPSSSQPVKGISEDALACLGKYPWPGNVRELENTIQRIISLIDHDFIQIEDVPEKIKSYSDAHLIGAEMIHSYKKFKNEKILQFGRQYLIEMLKENRGNISQISRSSGLSRTTLYRMLKKYNINKIRYI